MILDLKISKEFRQKMDKPSKISYCLYFLSICYYPSSISTRQAMYSSPNFNIFLLVVNQTCTKTLLSSKMLWPGLQVAAVLFKLVAQCQWCVSHTGATFSWLRVQPKYEITLAVGLMVFSFRFYLGNTLKRHHKGFTFERITYIRYFCSARH